MQFFAALTLTTGFDEHGREGLQVAVAPAAAYCLQHPDARVALWYALLLCEDQHGLCVALSLCMLGVFRMLGICNAFVCASRMRCMSVW